MHLLALEVGLLRRRHAVKAGARSGRLLPAGSSQRRYNALPYNASETHGEGSPVPCQVPPGPSPEGDVTLEGSGITWSRKGTWLGTPRRVPDLSLPQGGTRRRGLSCSICPASHGDRRRHLAAAPVRPQPPGAAGERGHERWRDTCKGHRGPWQMGQDRAGGGDANARAVSAVSPLLLGSKKGTSGRMCSACRSQLSSPRLSNPGTNSCCEKWAVTQTRGLSRARAQPCVHATAQALPSLC